MLRLVRGLLKLSEFIITAPLRALRFLFSTIAFNPRLGRMRLIVAPIVLYVAFALALTYVYAPIRGFVGQFWMGRVLAYADERSLATAIFDVKGRFVGIFDPLLDSERDFNYTGHPIRLPNYIAYPDHKSLHVGQVPEGYWDCLRYQEDRHLGGLINPFGIDLFGVLKIPVSTIRRSIVSGHVNLGVGGSTLSMQLARIFFKTPPSPEETAGEKLSRKFKEWWLAPVIQWQLTESDDLSEMKRWTANHFPLAQRTGGEALYGVEQTSLIVFGKPAERLSTAEQYVLAAAVNRPIILIANSAHMEQLQETDWQRLTKGRATVCADALIKDPARRQKVVAELDRLSKRPPDPHPMAFGQDALASLSPELYQRAEANPVFRSNALLPSVKYGVREELKDRFGYGWRNAVSAVHLTLDAADNLKFRRGEKAMLATLDKRYRSHIDPAYSLDFGAPAAADEAQTPKRHPDVIVAAADEHGRLVRYFDTNFNAAYFGSPSARDAQGHYDSAKEQRAIASIGKMVAGIAIADQGGDSGASQWLDTKAPETGLETCREGDLRRLRTAQVSFACSLNAPLVWRTAKVPVGRLKQTADALGITLTEPVTSSANLAKSLVVGHVAASPRTVQRMAAVVLASLTGDGKRKVFLPTLTAKLDLTRDGEHEKRGARHPLIPDDIVKPAARPALKDFLTAPICYDHGTMHRLSDWCADRHKGVALVFAKTGTRGTGASDPAADDTVDLWVAGGIKFDDGRSYSFVVVVGTGSPSAPWARDLYAGEIAEPLVRVLLQDLEQRPPPKQEELTAR